MSLPSGVLLVLEALEAAGFEAYLVGGCVRDMLRGEVPHDYDVTTDAAPGEMQTALAAFRLLPTGLKHGTLTALTADGPVEVTTYRTEGAYSDGRHPDSVAFTRSLSEDLRRRDFTVNAMAMDKAGKVVDLYGGKADLTAGVLRAVGDPRARFTEDALRILRAFRFAAKLNFAMEQETLIAALELAPRLSLVSRERIFAEIEQLFVGRSAANVLSVMADGGVFAHILPGATVNLASLYYLDALPRRADVRLAAWLLYEDDPAEHLRSLRTSAAFADRTLAIIACDLPADAEQPALRRAIARFGREAALDRARIHALASGDDRLLSAICTLCETENCFSVADLFVDGRDAFACGLCGREIGEALAAVLDAVFAEEIPHAREAELAFLRTLCEKH